MAPRGRRDAIGLGARLPARARRSARGREPILFFGLAFWLGGGMLYIWIISLIFYRYTFFPFSPSDLTPPYWINMGAMAISTLAGTLLVANAAASPLLQRPAAVRARASRSSSGRRRRGGSRCS